MKERIESMLAAMQGQTVGEPVPHGLKQLLIDLKYPRGVTYLMLKEVKPFLEEKPAEYE